MTQLVGPSGTPISSAMFKKASPPPTGPAFGNWAGREDVRYWTMPGGGVLHFDLSKLSLQDFRQMRDHYQINSSLTILQFMIHQIDWHIECSDQRVANLVEENLRQVWTRLVRAMGQAFWAGFAPTVIDWENDPKANDNKGAVVISRFKDLPPEESRVNWKKVDGWAPPDREPPKFRVYDGIMHTGSPQWPIPVDNTLWYPLLMENGDYYGRKLLRPAFTPWYFSMLIHLFTNRYFERFGEPLPIGRAPSDDEVDIGEATPINSREYMLKMLTSLRNRGVVVLPSDREQISDSKSEYLYDIDYLETQMRGADFDKYLDRLDEEMTLGLFTPLLLMRGAGAGGSHNLGVQHTQTYLWMLNALAGDMKEYIDFHVVRRIKDFNFGPNAPRVTWEFSPMGKENVETIRSIMSALVSGGKVMPDLEELGRYVGLDLTEIKEVTAPPARPEDEDPDTEDGGEDEDGDERDTRVRDRPDKKRTRPRGVGEPRATGRKISARIANQVTNAFEAGEFGSPIKMGYRREFEDSLESTGMSSARAAAVTTRLFDAGNLFLADLVSMGVSFHDSAESFIQDFDSFLEGQIARLEGDA